MNSSRFFADTPLTATVVAHAGNIGTVDLGDVESARNDVNTLGFEIQQLEDMEANINSLYAIAADSVDDGGLRAQAYTAIKAQAATVMRSTGFEPVNVNVQNFEGGITDRQTATQVCMLDLKTTAMNIWRAIIKAIKEAMAKVKEWFAKMTNVVPTLIKKFEAVKKDANAKTKGLKDDADIKLSAGNVSAIGSGKTPTITRDGIKGLAKTIDGNSAEILKLSKVIEDANKGAADTLGSAEAGTVQEAWSSVDKASKFIRVYVTALAGMGTQATEAQAKDLGIGEESKILPLDVGNQAVIFNVKAAAPGDLGAIGTVTDGKLATGKMDELKAHVRALGVVAPAQLSVRSVHAKVEDADEFEFKAFDSSDIVTMADDAIDLLTGFKKFKEEAAKIDVQRDKAIDKVEKFASKAGDLKGPEGEKDMARQVSDTAKAASNIVKQTGSLIPGFTGVAIRSMNIVLAVCNSSLSAHK